MKISKVLILLMIISILRDSTAALPLPLIIKTIEKVGRLTQQALELYNKYNNSEQANQPEQEKLLILEHLDNIDQQINTAIKYSEQVHSTITTLPTEIRLNFKLDNLLELCNYIESMHQKLNQYKELVEQEKLQNHTLDDFAHNAVSHSFSSIEHMLNQIHTIFVGHAGRDNNFSIYGFNYGLLPLVKNILKKDINKHICSLNQSPQQFIYNLYHLVATAEIKGFAIMQFSWFILQKHRKGNFSNEAELMTNLTKQRALHKLEVAATAMQNESTKMWKCEPDEQKEGETFIRLTEFIQGQIQNEVDLNDSGTCRHDCKFYSYAKRYGCYDNRYCKHGKTRQCNGRLFNCQFIGDHSSICQSAIEGRRYDWISYNHNDAKLFGKKQGICTNGTVQADGWRRWIFWKCSYCFCLCDEESSRSDRYFSLRKVISTVSSNKVITGIRFVKVNRVIHLQIQEAVVKARGKIDANTIRWQPVNSFTVENAKRYVDYHKMMNEQRALDLDDLIAPEGYALTGVRFRRTAMAHLGLHILVTPINLTTGILDHKSEVWIGVKSSTRRNELKIISPDVPTLSKFPNVPLSNPHDYVIFTHTDIHKDVAQTTIPYIDSQPVETSAPSLLSGAGLYYKGQHGFGGYVALKIFTFDFYQNKYHEYLNQEPPK